jgi:hypothetical protein
VFSRCPTGGVCEGGTSLPYPQKGYWIDRTSYEYGDEVYRCIFDTCTGFDPVQELDHRAMDCWTMTGFNRSFCEGDQMMCSEGSTGPLCGTCIKGYHYDSGDRRCKNCLSSISSFVNISLFLLAMFGFIAAVNIWERVAHNNLAFIVTTFFQNMESGTLKVIWVTYQIIVSAVFNLEIEVFI